MLLSLALFYFALLPAPQHALQQEVNLTRYFDVDYSSNTFVMDGSPFSYASGEMHYFRIPHQYWKDRLEKLRAAGLNAVSTYVDWAQHEPYPGKFIFEGDLDIIRFIQLAEDVGLYVILRPGPYICAEREFGGFPAWLLSVNPTMKLRTSDSSYTFFVMKWFKKLMPMMEPYLYGNGGPIIMVQVENEYGSYPLHDPNYLLWLRDVMRSYVRNAAVLFTTDGPGTNLINHGHIPGVFATIDFGPTNKDVLPMFNPLRKIQPRGPLVNSEFYAGWISYWGQDFSTTEIGPIVDTMKQMLERNISFNIYMFHGGTNFGFTSGSGSDAHFLADLTSYDYDAPMSEAGDLTDKYLAIKEVLKDEYPMVDYNHPLVSPKGDYGRLTLVPIISLLDSPISTHPILSEYPMTFEELGQWFGFVAYHTTINRNTKDPSVLQVIVRDRAIVYLDKEEVAVLQYTVINETPLPPTSALGQRLTLLVENQGRRNYKLLSDCTKGMVTNATLDDVILKDWEIVGYPLSPEDIASVEALEPTTDKEIILPAYFSVEFVLPDGEEPKDTFLDMSEWGKGVAFINGFNLGRYWHLGPQVTLYVPGVHLKAFPMKNRLTLMELHFPHPDKTVSFLPYPILNKTISDGPSVNKPPSVVSYLLSLILCPNNFHETTSAMTPGVLQTSSFFHAFTFNHKLPLFRVFKQTVT